LLVCFVLRLSWWVVIIDRQDNNVPKDASATRAGILSAAMQTLQRSGVEGFTLDAVARRAGVVKGLVLYHYASRARLLRAAATQIADSRDSALTKALASGSGMQGVDACWEELRRQAEDGTARAWLSLCAAGLIDRSARNHRLEDAAREAVVDGCAVALASGVQLADARDTYNALWLALLDLTEPV
jgi:AcrR family transcriptional regulator